METHQRQFGAKVSKLSLWVIEYIWAHKMADVLEGRFQSLSDMIYHF